MGKRDFRGKLVSKEEVLRELGDPAGWGKMHRKLEFEKHLVFGQKELNLCGIKGLPGSLTCGYLEFLEKEFEHPIGSETGLVSAGKNFHIEEQEKEAIKDEIRKYTDLLGKLEKNPKEVSDYLDRMKQALKDLMTNPLYGDLPPDNFGDDEEGRTLVKEENLKRRENIRNLRKEIRKYTARLKKLEQAA